MSASRGGPAEHGHPPVAALLAGGSGSRFLRSGSLHKLDALLAATSSEPAETVFDRALRHLHGAGFRHVVVVTGSWTPSPEQNERLADLPLTRHHVVHNAQWTDGQITSVRLAVQSAAELGAERVVIGLADQPFLSPDAWRTVANTPGSVVVATYGGRRGNPVALDRPVWDLLPEEGDEGARALMRVRPDLVCEVACSGSPADIDTAEDLRRWQNN